MIDKEKISHRSFLRGTMQAGGALMLAGALPAQAAGLFAPLSAVLSPRTWGRP